VGERRDRREVADDREEMIKEERQVLVRRLALERRRSQSVETTPYRISSFRAIFNRISGEEGWIIL
jgi:hypothetical protein